MRGEEETGGGGGGELLLRDTRGGRKREEEGGRGRKREEEEGRGWRKDMTWIGKEGEGGRGVKCFSDLREDCAGGREQQGGELHPMNGHG